MKTLPQAPSNCDFQRIPLAVIYPDDGIEFILVHTDVDGEWSETFRTGDDLGVYDFEENGKLEDGFKEDLKKLGWKILVDKS
ncbi:MAG: hypothetical protein GQ474_05985 [Sulfurimonas sp.]|nr:hypothetical protein [Sulfurimonas sp.]